EVATHGQAHAVVGGDGGVVWPRVIEECLAGQPRPVYEGGRIAGDQFVSARWDLLPERRYMWASVQTVRGCPKHCSFCSVWRTDGQEPRQRGVDRVVREIVELRRLGFKFIALADDNFYPVTLDDLAQARRRNDSSRLRELQALRARLREFRRHDIHVLGSFIFGLPSDGAETFDATVALAEEADLTFAQFVLLTPFPGTIDFDKWAREEANRAVQVDGIPITRHW